MKLNYVYPATRVKTVSYGLLSENQLERLLGAKDDQELIKVLQDTFLKSFVGKIQDISKSLEDCLNQAKVLISSLCPDREITNLLLLEFDFFNLKVITKGKLANDSLEEIKEKATFTGNYSFEKLFKYFEEKNLGSLNKNFKNAVDRALDKKDVSPDLIFDEQYLLALKSESKGIKNKFVRQFISKLIDLSNVKTALRLEKFRLAGIEIKVPFVDGGKISKKDLEDEAKIADIFKKFSHTKKWQEAWEEYKKTNNFSGIEMVSEEELLDFLTSKSFDLFSPATLFAYFYRLRNNLNIVRTIVLSKNAGLSELEIRRFLKKLY